MKSRFIKISLFALSIWTLAMFISSSQSSVTEEDYTAAKENVQKYVGKEFVYPENLTIVGSNSEYIDSLKNLPHKFAVFINADCGTCTDQLSFWKKFMSDLQKENIECGFLFYMKTLISEEEELRQNTLIPHDFSHPVMLDPEWSMINTNNLYDRGLEIVLLDEKNKIRVIGPPYDNPSMVNLYMKVLRKNK